MLQMLQVLRERATGMLTAGMSTRAVAHELNNHFSTISHLQRRFREFGSTSNRPQNHRPRVTTPAQYLHIQHPHIQDRLRPSTRTAAAIIGLHNQRIYAQTVINCLREAHLHAHWGLDLTAVRHRNRLEWANAHIRWRLALRRGVFFTNESWFSLYRADGRQRVWCRVGERFADVNVVDRVAHGGGGLMVWAGVCYGQRTKVHFIDGILNAQRYRVKILSPIVVPFIHDHHLMLQHDNARPHVARICTQFQEAENIPVLAWPAYSPDMPPIEHVWDALDQHIRQHVPVPANIQQLRTAVKEERNNIPQAKINNLINSMQRRCVALLEANGGHTRYWLVLSTNKYLDITFGHYLATWNTAFRALWSTYSIPLEKLKIEFSICFTVAFLFTWNFSKNVMLSLSLRINQKNVGKCGLAIEIPPRIMHGSNEVKHLLMCFLKFPPALVYIFPLENIGVRWNLDPDYLIAPSWRKHRLQICGPMPLKMTLWFWSS